MPTFERLPAGMRRAILVTSGAGETGTRENASIWRRAGYGDLAKH